MPALQVGAALRVPAGQAGEAGHSEARPALCCLEEPLIQGVSLADPLWGAVTSPLKGRGEGLLSWDIKAEPESQELLAFPWGVGAGRGAGCEHSLRHSIVSC